MFLCSPRFWFRNSTYRRYGSIFFYCVCYAMPIDSIGTQVEKITDGKNGNVFMLKVSAFGCVLFSHKLLLLFAYIYFVFTFSVCFSIFALYNDFHHPYLVQSLLCYLLLHLFVNLLSIFFLMQSQVKLALFDKTYSKEQSVRLKKASDWSIENAYIFQFKC